MIPELFLGQSPNFSEKHYFDKMLKVRGGKAQKIILFNKMSLLNRHSKKGGYC